jgi:cytidylate kinase
VSATTRRRPVIAIDGPAGAGKSTAAMALARALGYLYVDTGAMYRALTLVALRRGVDPGDGPSLERLAADVRIETVFRGEEVPPYRVLADGEDVTEAIRRPEVSGAVSQVSAHPGVRNLMAEAQRRLARGGGVVMEGRDVGTVVLPEADLKFFITASPGERARRRHRELLEKGIRVSREEVERDISRRDMLDSTRPTAPLRRAPDALLVDTTGLTPEEVLRRLLEAVEELLGIGGVGKGAGSAPAGGGGS